MEKWKCSVCGYIHEGPLPEGFACPICKQPAAVFEKSGVQVWECRNCGHIVVGVKAPDLCPVCKHPQSYFEVRKENY